MKIVLKFLINMQHFCMRGTNRSPQFFSVIMTFLIPITHHPLCSFTLFISIFFPPPHLCPSLSVWNIPRASTEGRRPSPHAVPMSFLSARCGAWRERPDRLPPQPHPGAHCRAVCAGTDLKKQTVNTVYSDAQSDSFNDFQT